MADLLLEIFSEEIPARMQGDAEVRLAADLSRYCLEQGLPFRRDKFDTYKTFVTPRRLGIWVKGLPVSQETTETEIKGPKVGAPDAAIQGFLKKNSLKQSDLTERDGTYFAVVRKEGRQTADVLKSIIEDMLKNFPWPKSMRWGAGDVTWVRPLHSILCIFDGKIVPVEFGGIKANNFTYGHRFLSPGKITVTHPAEYEPLLEKAHVIADRDKRRDNIWAQAEKAAGTKGLTIKRDDWLLEEVTGLVEWPVVLMGSIDAKFMDLPPEVLSTVMRKHQKYFSLLDKDGKLSPHFLIVANMEAKDGGKNIIAGNERVLRARFSDARFFWDQDRKKSLDEWANGLKDVTFHAKLGTMADKVVRIKALAMALTQYVSNADKKLVERAAVLCKADLVTGMVGEFAELQGIMGRYYALTQNEPPQVADAIRDHYKPQGPNDSVPSNPVSLCIALADKLDTLISMFAIGEKPTGSKDPFALRRAALGVIRIILEKELRIPFSQLNLKDDLLAFFSDRLKVILKEQEIRHDLIDAVLDYDIYRCVTRVHLLQDFLNTENGANLLIAYKRAANILAIEEKKHKTQYLGRELNVSALKEEPEITLIKILEQKSPILERLRNEEKFIEAMKLLAELRAPIDHFFDKIMVNCDNEELRTNRLRLLSRIRNSIDFIANFALIEG